MKRIKLVTLLLTIVSCASPSSTEQNESHQSQTTLVDTLTVSESKPEEFSAFFHTFRKDSVFQKSRIQFPLVNEFVDFNQNEGEYFNNSEQISADDWKYKELEIGSMTEEKKISAFTSSLQVTGDTAEYHMRGVDNGIHSTYQFVLQDKQWYLVRIVDNSM